jgi:hypothetical protein
MDGYVIRITLEVRVGLSRSEPIETLGRLESVATQRAARLA